MSAPFVAWVCAIVANIECQPYSLLVDEHGEDATLVVRGLGVDAETGQPKVLEGRRWLLARYCSVADVVQTALKAILTFAEHEIRESFKWRGRAIYAPHYHPNALWHLHAGRGDLAGPIFDRPEGAGGGS